MTIDRPATPDTGNRPHDPLTPETVSAILRDPNSPYHPTQITVFCDTCRLTETADYLVKDSLTRDERLDVARRYLARAKDWQTDETGDYCPPHAGRAGQPDTDDAA